MNNLITFALIAVLALCSLVLLALYALAVINFGIMGAIIFSFVPLMALMPWGEVIADLKMDMGL